MKTLEQKALALHCLTCKDEYTPVKDCLPAEYPFCMLCNMKEARGFFSLPIITLAKYNSAPGKRNGKKTEVAMEKKRKLNPRPKRTYAVSSAFGFPVVQQI